MGGSKFAVTDQTSIITNVATCEVERRGVTDRETRVDAPKNSHKIMVSYGSSQFGETKCATQIAMPQTLGTSVNLLKQLFTTPRSEGSATKEISYTSWRNQLKSS